MSGALAGVHVVDFGHYIAGPLAATMLSDQGADVIHVDAPGGPRWNTPADAFLNRGKRRIALDLKDAHDLAVAQNLVERSDILVENFRPEVMDRLGLGSSEMRRRNPRLIYCSMPGFAADDPRASMQAWEGIVAAATGNCRARAGEAPPDWDTSRPTYSAIPLASNFAAFLAATSAVMALIARERSGRGQHVEVPLFHAMFTAIGPAGAYVTARGLREPRPIDVNGSGTYRCGDGRYIQFDPSNHRFLTWFAQAAGISDWGPDFLDIRRLKDLAANHRLHERLADLFMTRSAVEWETLANDAGAVLAAVRTAGEWLTTEHARVFGAAVHLDDPVLGSTWMAGMPVSLTGSPGEVRGPRHLPDADRADILAELANQSPHPSLLPEGEGVASALDGIYVLDLTQVLAGPTCGRLLAEFGADVVKINGPQRRIGSHGYLNRGKRSVLLDVESPEGQKAFWKLLEQADVLIQNFPRGTAEHYGIGYDQVRPRKPDIIYTSLSCYGYVGPWGAGRGYERQAQAVTGVMDRVGDVPAILGPYNLVDIGTGVLTTFATALAIYHRCRTGAGQHVQTSLSQTATYHQTPFMLQYAGKPATSEDEPRGWEALGTGPTNRFYRASDGWFFLAATPDQIERLNGVLGTDQSALRSRAPRAQDNVPPLRAPAAQDSLPPLRGSSDEASHLVPPDSQAVASEAKRTAVAYETILATRTVAHWVDCLRRAGISAQAVVSLPDLMLDPWVRSHGLSVSQASEEVGDVTYPGVSVRMTGTPMCIGPAAKRPGGDAQAVLVEAGLAEAIPALERAWALQTTNPPPGW
jgi:crotonobetainyl-CoA:carnitine CoA-transferase CaiB-like acyl-CoA transferase